MSGNPWLGHMKPFSSKSKAFLLAQHNICAKKCGIDHHKYVAISSQNQET